MKKKALTFVEITVVLCSLFLVALPTTTIAAGQDDCVLGVYGNANEDDTIDMRDLTYEKLIFFGKKPETELADAKYDGKINPLDFIQIKLIIVGKGEELTVVDTADRIVTMKKPVERIIAPYTGNVETLRSLKAKDIIVGVGSVSEPVFLSEFEEIPVIGTMWDPDVEAILNLDPDVVILHSMSTGSWGTALEAAQRVLETAGVTVLRFNTNQADIYLEEVEKLGYVVGKREEAEALINFYNRISNQIEEKVAGIPEEDKPTVYFESSSPYSLSGAYSYVEEAGGRNIFSDLDGTIDKEELISRNPDIILKGVWGARDASGYRLAGGYELDADDTAFLAGVREEIMNRPELENVKAVKEGKVYIMSSRTLCFMPGSGCRHFLQRAYQAKWFHPDLFEDLDPKALHQEYLTRFHELDIDLEKKGVFVYPEPS